MITKLVKEGDRVKIGDTKNIRDWIKMSEYLNESNIGDIIVLNSYDAKQINEAVKYKDSNMRMILNNNKYCTDFILSDLTLMGGCKINEHSSFKDLIKQNEGI